MGAVASGARDNNNFRNNAGISMQESSITYEGILNEYSYGIGEELEHLFNTTYTSAISKDPGGGLDHYMCLEMKSKLDGDGLARHGGRPPMNFSFVLDVSGSMSCGMASSDNSPKTKLAVAQECLINLLSKLQPQDNFGLILFTETATVSVPMCSVGSADIKSIKSSILASIAGGGTKILPAMNAAEKMLKSNPNKENKTNRIFFLTDMNPNDDCDIVEVGHKLAKKDIYITLVGIGIDFNSDLAQKFCSIKGCYSFSVSSADEFRKQMNEDFDYTSMVICYDVSLKLAANSDWEVEETYGSPNEPGIFMFFALNVRRTLIQQDKKAGEVLKMGTICPSPPSRDGGIKGGIVVLKLKRKNENNASAEDLKLELTYKDWDDNQIKKIDTYKVPEDPQDKTDYFENVSTRKAVALIRYHKYACFLVKFAFIELRYVKTLKAVLKDKQNDKNTQLLEDLKAYLIAEITALNDPTMEKELTVIESLRSQFEAQKTAQATS